MTMKCMISLNTPIHCFLTVCTLMLKVRESCMSTSINASVDTIIVS